MDTSEQYIKMCDCSEIQEDKVAFRDKDNFVRIETEKGFYYMWLPRQDQIEKMIDLTTPWEKAYFLYHFAEQHRNPNESYPFESMEQLWIAFYMYEKHEKKWNGEKWI